MDTRQRLRGDSWGRCYFWRSAMPTLREVPPDIEIEIIAEHVFNLGLCVPADATDEQIKKAINAKYPSGTTAGWHRRDGVRKPCEQNAGRVHIVVDF